MYKVQLKSNQYTIFRSRDFAEQLWLIETDLWLILQYIFLSAHTKVTCDTPGIRGICGIRGIRGKIAVDIKLIRIVP